MRRKMGIVNDGESFEYLSGIQERETRIITKMRANQGQDMDHKAQGPIHPG